MPSEYITESELNSSLSTKANTSDIPSLTGYATETYVMNKLGGKSLIYLTQSEYDLLSDTEKQDSTKVYNITDAVIDYNELANTPTIPTKTSELNNDSGFITSVPSEYITETELSAKSYATETYVKNKIAEAALSGGEVDLSEYVTETELSAKGYATQSYVMGAISNIDNSVDNSFIKNINSGWLFKKTSTDSYDLIFDDSSFSKVNIPHSCNITDGEDGGGNYYRGITWYRKHLSMKKNKNKKYFLKFNASNLVTTVYFNGQLLGTHEGGYTSFVYDITDYLVGGENVIAVKVNNGSSLQIAPLSADYTFYNGIYRDVEIMELNNIHFDKEHYGSDGILFKQNTNATDLSTTLTVLSRVKSDVKKNISLNINIKDASNTSIYSQSYDVSLSKGLNEISKDVQLTNITLWNGKINPYLYTVDVNLVDGEEVCDSYSHKYGFRTYEVDYNNGFLLNGKQYNLRGVNRHQQKKGLGWCLSELDDDYDFELIEDLGANAIRLAHYPQSNYIYNKCDELGIIVWSEIPFVNDALATNAFKENLKTQLQEMIYQHYNSTCIAVWGMFNEIGNGSVSNSITNASTIVPELVTLAKSIDTRLTTGATNTVSFVENTQDLCAWNIYTGWYNGTVENFGTNINSYRGSSRKMGVSEYGAGANINQHMENPVLGTDVKANGEFHPEEYQSYFHESYYSQIKTRNWLWCTFIWAMFDFAVDNRNEGSQLGLNDKGIVTADRMFKKDAYYFYKAHWNNEPMVHLCSKRYTNRTTDSFTPKVYSNCDSVTLYINDNEIQTISAPTNDVVFNFNTFTASTEINNVKVIGIKNDIEYEDSCSFNVVIGSGSDDTFGNIVLSTNKLTIDSGVESTFTVNLDTAPTNSQIVTVSSSNGTVVNPSTLTFDSTNYNKPQTVTVSATSSDTITVSSDNVPSKTVVVTVNGSPSAPTENSLVCSLSYDNISDTTLNDLSGNNNTGTLSKAASVSNNYLQFNGDNAIKVNNLSIADGAPFVMKLKIHADSATDALSRILQSNSENLLLFVDGKSGDTTRKIVFKCSNITTEEIYILHTPKLGGIDFVVAYNDKTKKLIYKCNGSVLYDEVQTKTLGLISDIYLCNRSDEGRPLTGGFYEFKVYNYYDSELL